MPAAAESTPHAPDADHGGGAVIHISDRFRRPRRTKASLAPAPHPAGDATDPEPSALDHIAYRIQSLFTARDRTLTDNDTAEAYAITLDGVLGLLDGALAEGVLGEEQYQSLRALLEAMRSAPSRL
ncbi:hypothetical protein ACFRCX_30795 [Streptomyces sp. NPDC056652]|uniref:hypothetical protein n=1 Tax=Streptomyces sp. NPDC056652 TaxID=3345893 RepID=UPI0036823A02